MTTENHFLANFNLLALSLSKSVSFFEIIIFSFIFQIILDGNQIIGKYLKKPKWHRRTFVEEPLGIILIGLPVAFLLSLIKPEYFWITIISYALHVLLDYISVHEVSPLAPFFKKDTWVGFFKSMRSRTLKININIGKEGRISEEYFLLLNIIVASFIIILY